MPQHDLNQFRLQDFLTGPVASFAIPALSAFAGMTRRIPTRYGHEHAGFSGAVGGGLTGLDLITRMQEQNRKLKEKQGFKGALKNLSAATQTVERPKTFADLNQELETASREAGPGFGTSTGQRISDFVDPSPTIETEEPMFSPRQQRIIETIGPYAPEAVLKPMITNAFKEPKTPSPFAKPPLPTTRIYTPESMREWRKTRTTENPLGDRSILEPRKKELSPRDKAFAELTKEEQRGVQLGQGKMPPVVDDNLVDQAAAELAEGGEISSRVVAAYGTNDPATIKKRVDFRNAIRLEREKKDKQSAMEVALAKQEGTLDMKTMPGMVLDAETGKVVNITMGDFARNPRAYVSLSPAQEKIKGGIDTAKNHVLVTTKMIGVLPKTGMRVTNVLGRKLGQLFNDKESVLLFQSLDAMTSLALGGALISAGGGRPGVRLAEFMRPAGVTEGDTFGVAVGKMQVWMQDILFKTAQDAGIPLSPYQEAVEEMGSNILKHLTKEAGGDVNKAIQLAKQYGLVLPPNLRQGAAGIKTGQKETLEEVRRRLLGR